MVMPLLRADATCRDTCECHSLAHHPQSKGDVHSATRHTLPQMKKPGRMRSNACHNHTPREPIR
jgi:hypothetical protein